MAKHVVSNQTAATVLTPSPGQTAIFVDAADKKLKTKDDSGAVTDYSSMASVPSLAVQYLELSEDDVQAKAVTLPHTPIGAVAVDMIGGAAQALGDDFTVSGAVLSWAGLGMDGILVAGDKLRVFYLHL